MCQPTTASYKSRFTVILQYSNLFPCPMVKTLDMDSPEGSLSSLGIVSGLNPHHVGPFASNTSAALMRRAGALGAAARSVRDMSRGEGRGVNLRWC